MKAISLWQPWASLMAYGIKKIETRAWPTKYRGPLIIHAAKKVIPWPSTEIELVLKGAVLHYGCLLCMVDLIDCQKIVAPNFKPGYPEYYFGDYTRGRFMWITENARPIIRPIPYRGNQGFFDVSEDVLPQP